MPINRILASKQDVQIAIRTLDDEIRALKSNVASITSGTVKNGSGGSNIIVTPPSSGVTFSGDLNGNSSSQTVVGIQGIPVSSVAPTNNQLFQYNGSMWVPTSNIIIPGTLAVVGQASLQGGALVTGNLTTTNTITANGGFIVPNSQMLGFNDPTNTFQNYEFYEGSGGTFNLYSKASAGAGLVYMFAANPSNFVFSIPVAGNAGISVANNQMLGFYDPTNAFQNYQFLEGSGGTFNLYSKASAGAALSYIFAVNPSNFVFSIPVTANAGENIANSQYLGFLDPTNAFPYYNFSNGSGNTFNLYYKTSAGGALTYIWAVNPSNFVMVIPFTIQNGVTVYNNTAVGFNDPTNAFQNHQIIEGAGGNLNFQYRPNTSTAWANVIHFNGPNAVTGSPGIMMMDTGGYVGNNVGLGFLDPTNAFSYYQFFNGTGNTFHLQYRSSAGAAFSDIFALNPSNCVWVIPLTANAGITFPNNVPAEQYLDATGAWIYWRFLTDPSNNLILQRKPSSGAAFSNAAYFSNAGTLITGNGINNSGAGTIDNSSGPIRALAGNALQAFSSDNTKSITISCDANFGYIQATTNVIVLPGNTTLRFGTSTYGDTNDGRIVGNGALGSPGLNIVGINSDNTNRKISFWGSLNQQDAGACAFNGATIFNSSVQISGSGLNVLGWGIKYGGMPNPTNVHAFNWTGSLQAYVNNSNVGNITLTSERSMKEDIKPYEAGLNSIKQLKPVSFKYVPQPWRHEGQTHYGLIADEVEPVAPEMIEYNTTEVEGEQKELRYTNPRPLWYMMLNAIKELGNRLEDLEKKLKLQEG